MSLYLEKGQSRGRRGASGQKSDRGSGLFSRTAVGGIKGLECFRAGDCHEDMFPVCQAHSVGREKAEDPRRRICVECGRAIRGEV